MGFKKRAIQQGERLGSILRAKRKAQGLDLLEVELETKIAIKYLKAIEKGNFELLPEPLYTRGFVLRYVNFLGLDAQKLLDVFEQEYKAFNQIRHFGSKQSKEGLLRPEVKDHWLRAPKTVTPEVIWGTGISLLLVGVLGYIWFQVASFAAAPSLELVNPESTNTAQEQIEIRGQTDPSAELRINNELVSVDEEGNFSQKIQLIDGLNVIEISAQNKTNKTTTKLVKVLAEVEESAPYGPFLPEQH